MQCRMMWYNTVAELIWSTEMLCVTFVGSLGDLSNAGYIRRQFGKERNGNGCTDPATDVTHQHRVLVTKAQIIQTCNTNHLEHHTVQLLKITLSVTLLRSQNETVLFK